jgi:histidinol-phosphate aminotransferase
MKPVKPNIYEMRAYSVPQQFDGIKLNQNESSIDVPMEIKEQILLRMKQAQWNRYPENFPRLLTQQIAAYTGFPVEGIMVGNSSNELIQTVIHGCCDSGDHILTVTPTFSVYHQVASVMNIVTHQVPLNTDFSFNLSAITEKLKKSNRVKAVILASPNNPTGTVMELEAIEAIAGKSTALVVIDEAYFEFCGGSAQSLPANYENVVVLRTFSKAFSAAGIRLGYLMAQPRLIKEFNKVKLPFSVGLFQQIAGKVLLENREWLEKHVRTVIHEREHVFTHMEKIPGIEPIPSQANFILFRSTGKPANELYENLYNKGVLVRAFSSLGLKDMLRVSIGTSLENSLFLEKLREILREKEKQP